MRCARHEVGKERGGDVNLQQLWLLPHIMCLRPCAVETGRSELCLLGLEGLIEMPDGVDSLVKHKASAIVHIS